MNKTKKVAWHKHLKRAHKLEARAHAARTTPRPTTTTTTTTTRAAAASRATTRPATRQTTPRRP